MLALSDAGPQIYTLDCTGQTEILKQEDGYPTFESATFAKYSPVHGKSYAVVDAQGIHVVDIDTKQIICSVSRPGIVGTEWSPKETYLITCEKMNLKEEFNGTNGNLNLWNATTGEHVKSFEFRNTPKDLPKTIGFDVEEKFCARQINKNIIEIYEGNNLKEQKFSIKSKLPPLPKVDGQPQVDNRVDNSKFDGFLFCPMPAENKGSTNAPYYFMAW